MHCLIDLHYLPSIAYFSVLLRHEGVVLEKHEHYVKQSFRNRCSILTANGTQPLIIPLTAKHTLPNQGKIPIKDVRIDYSQKWLNNHWRAVTSAYRNAPYFEHYADDLHDNLFGRQAFLYDLNYNLLTMCLNWLNAALPVQETSSYEKTPANGIVDLRNALIAKKTETLDTYYKPVAYTQVFGNGFVKHLSIIDLVFCRGPEARKVIEAGAPVK
ncbi:MAG: WbqC family protein [Cyclobacteriaceae bacterium]|nr:WbqC family protein [Cyclobacteriaceae bacterium]